MERFLERHGSRITGVLSGFDRVLFRGTLLLISNTNGMNVFLSRHSVLYKDFGRFAEGLSDRIKAHVRSWCEKQGRPLVYLESSAISKEDTARQIMEQDNIKQGLICILSCVEPCQSFAIRKDREAKELALVPAKRKCLHFYLYYLDREFGFMHIRLQTWLPFTMQVCINGREYLARRMDRVGMGYERRDNCFTHIDDLPQAQRMIDDLIGRKWVRFLSALARRVNPLIGSQGDLDLHDYYWSIRQGEYATDVMFKDANSLKAVYPQLVNHAIQNFSCQDVLRFLGRRTNIRFNGEVSSDIRCRPEGVRIKHRAEENSIKMYDKQGSVLRIETTINNPRRFKVRRPVIRQGQRIMAWIPMRKGVADIARRVELSRAANERYLEALSLVGEPTVTHQLLDPISKRVLRKGRPYRPLRPISLEDAALFRVVLRGEFMVQGFRNRDLQDHLVPNTKSDPIQRRQTSGRITRWLRLLRAHGLIRKVSGTRYYRVTMKGHHVMTAALKIREIDVNSLAA